MLQVRPDLSTSFFTKKGKRFLRDLFISYLVRAVTLKEGMEFAALYNVPFFSTSAKTGENVVNAVEEIVRQMRDKRERGKKKSKNKNSTKRNIPDSTVVIQAPPSTLVRIGFFLLYLNYRQLSTLSLADFKLIYQQ